MYADADAATIREKAAEYKNLQSSHYQQRKEDMMEYESSKQQNNKKIMWIGAFEDVIHKKNGGIVRQKKHGTV